MACKETVIINGKQVQRDCASKQTAQASEIGVGAGTELKAILKQWLGIEANFGCSCNAMARAMNQRGTGWVRGDGMQSVLAAMQAEHSRRAKKGQTRLPWSRFGAKQLVLLACRRAEAKLKTA